MLCVRSQAGRFSPGNRLYGANVDAVGISSCHDACNMSLGCGAPSCSDASSLTGSTVASAHRYITSTILPAFASADSSLFSTGVDPTDGSVVHDFGAPNEQTKISVRSTAPWVDENRGVGAGYAAGTHTAVAVELHNSFGPEIGGRPKIVVFGGKTDLGYTNELVFFIPDDNIYSFFDAANGTDCSPTPRADHSAVLESNIMRIFFGRTATGVADDVW